MWSIRFWNPALLPGLALPLSLHQLHFPIVSAVLLHGTPRFGNVLCSLVFTTSSLTPPPGFWTPNYDSSNPAKYDCINLPAEPETCTFHSALGFHSHCSPCQEYSLSCQMKHAFQSQLGSTSLGDFPFLPLLPGWVSHNTPLSLQLLRTPSPKGSLYI